VRRLGRRSESAPSRALRLGLVAALVVAAAFNLGLALVMLGHVEETRYGEALIYGHAARLLHGEALYQPLDGPPYTIVSYTPLYYWVAAGLHALVGPGLLAGRVVSFVCGLVGAGCVGYLVWRRSRAASPTLSAALLAVALGQVGPVPWTAAYKEDVLAVALAVGSTAVLDGAHSRRRVVLAAVLAAAALLSKQSLVGPTVAGTLWLLLCRPRRAAVWFAGTVGVLVGVTALGLEASSGAFVANTVGGNSHQPFDRLTFEHNLSELVTFQSAPAVLALLAVLLGGRLRHDLLALSWLGALIPILPIGAIGADYNYWLQFAALSSALAVTLVWERRLAWLGALGAAVLLAGVLFGLVVVVNQLRRHPEYVLPAPEDAATLERLVERVRSAPGFVLADPLDVVVLADRPIVLEPILYSLLEQDGTWDARPLLERICGGEVGLVVLGYPLGEVGQRFPASIGRALQQVFVVTDSVQLGGKPRYVLVRDPAARCT
jgi:hypothetical protein